MNIQYLIIANTSIIFVYLLFTRSYRTKLTIDHLVLLLAGIFFYWFIPIYAYENKLYIYHHIELYESIHIENIEIFLYFSLFFVLILLLSDFISSKFPVVFSLNKFCYSKIILDLFFWFIFIATCISAYFMRNVFFHGYEMSSEWPFQRGWFISGCLSLTTLNIMYSCIQITNQNFISRKKLFKKMFYNKYFISALLFNLLMLSTGNRGYIVSFSFSIILIYVELYRGIKIKYLIMFIGFLILLTSFVALIRSGADFTKVEAFIGMFFYESVNVGVTLLYHLQYMDYSLFEFPAILISKLIGIIPSVIFPGKFALMVSPEFMGKIVNRFQGTTHNYVELLINFGLIGTIFFFFFLGICFNWLKSKKHYTPIYIAVSANIPFFFFRSFYDATVKHMLEFSILLPLVILYISYAYRKYKTRKY